MCFKDEAKWKVHKYLYCLTTENGIHSMELLSDVPRLLTERSSSRYVTLSCNLHKIAEIHHLAMF